MKEWVKALRSNKYKQGKKFLTSNDKYCSLGVLCKIAENNYIVESCKSFNVTKYGTSLNEDFPPFEVITWAKLKIGKKLKRLIQLNDNGVSFKRISNIIEKNYKEL